MVYKQKMEIKIPEQLCKEELKFLLIQKNKKEPIEINWQNQNCYSYNEEKLKDHLKNGGNYGVIGGYGNLIIIDADSKEINEIAEKLPETLTIKTGSPEEYKKHYFFITEKEMKPIRLSKEKVGDLGDIRSVGQYVVAPNSTHPSGNLYYVEKNNPITFINTLDLKDAFSNFINTKNEYKGCGETKDFMPDTTKRLTPYITSCKMLDYCRQEKLKGNTSKNLKLFRYLVDIAYNRGVSADVLKEICEKQQHNWGAIKGWIKLVGEGKLEKGNCPKMKEYITFYHKDIIPEVCNKCQIKTVRLSLGPVMIHNYLENVKTFYEQQPFFFDKSNMFWFWNEDESKYEPIDETDLMRGFDNALSLEGKTLSATIKNQYLEAFRRIGRDKHPKDSPVKWIQFKDKAYSLKSGKIYKVTPEYFFTNPIPHDLGETSDTPVMDKLFNDWVGEKYVSTLYEIMAYCCYRRYPIQVLFCLYGSGRNGKSCFLRLLNGLLGNDNVCSTDLDLIAGMNKSRFEVFKLYKKLACQMGETNFGMLSSSSLLKKLTGDDLIGFEKKGKDGFDDYSYAKIIIASNSLPSSQDTSDGFYRRWVIIPFPNEFPEGKDILSSVPDVEFDNLSRKIISILPKLIDKGVFTNQGSIDERKNRYIMASNPLPLFINNCCVKGDLNYVLYGKLYMAYVNFLNYSKMRKVKMKEFKSALEDEGLWVEKTAKKNGGEFVNGYWVDGLMLNGDWKKCIKNINFDNFDNFPEIPTQKNSSYVELGFVSKLSKLSKTKDNSHTSIQNDTTNELIHHKCSFCGETPCADWHLGKPVCKECFSGLKAQKVQKW